ncbi:unnamed protein product [Allacma fusca]|uniref:Uncharacterized protein n=1 Tax=Allacma fusca TaxID=39272 RepID=A0A8J2KRA9_9HEXA|nr:unnamed protein product [Allacma fusca]
MASFLPQWKVMAFRPDARGAEQPMRRPNIRSRAVCRFCVHCSKPVSVSWASCRFEYCRQPIVQLVPMPETPPGWSICQGCQFVFIKDGQRFCGLWQYRTSAGTAYQRAFSQRLRDIMNHAEQIRNQFIPVAPEQNPP